MASLLVIVPIVASACNFGTESGVTPPVQCAVRWDAKVVMDSTLTNDDPDYPGLMVDSDGVTPVHFVNGGNIKEVTPILGDPGMLEINHFYHGAGAFFTQVWRLPVATDYTILDAKLTFTLPQEIVDADLPVTFDAVSTNSNIKGWGPTYGKYRWISNKATAVDNGDGTWSVDLGDLARGTGTVFQFNVLVGDAFTAADRFIASAYLEGTYAPGTNGGQCPLPDVPALPELEGVGPCQAEFVGQTLWSVYDNDITNRIKVYAGEASDLMGEVNADGWGAGADAWGEGSTRFFRLYAATVKPLENVTWTIDAVQGMSFKLPADPTTIGYQSPAGGMLPHNGYVNTVSGVTITPSADGSQITIAIESMEASSSISFGMEGLLDGSGSTMVLHSRLVGDLPGCVIGPDPVVTEGEWTVVKKDCPSRKVTEERTITTVPYVWDAAKLEYVAGEPVVTTEQRVRDMTAEEFAVCALEDDDAASVTTTTPAAPTTPKPAPDAPVTTKTVTTPSARNPKTGDASAALGLAAIVGSGAAVIVSTRKKR